MHAWCYISGTSRADRACNPEIALHRAATDAQAMSERSKQFLRNFDIDGDGTFSCEEFILFLVMLSMPLKDMQSIFVLMDADGSQTLDKDEFLSAVEGMLEMTGHAQKKGISRGQILFTCDRKCALPPLRAACEFRTSACRLFCGGRVSASKRQRQK